MALGDFSDAARAGALHRLVSTGASASPITPGTTSSANPLGDVSGRICEPHLPVPEIQTMTDAIGDVSLYAARPGAWFRLGAFGGRRPGACCAPRITKRLSFSERASPDKRAFAWHLVPRPETCARWLVRYGMVLVGVGMIVWLTGARVSGRSRAVELDTRRIHHRFADPRRR